MHRTTRRILRILAGVSLLPAMACAAEAALEGTGTLATSLAPKGQPLRLGLDLYGNGWESTITQSRIAGAEVRGEFSRRLADALTVQLGAGLVVEAGVARARFTDEFRPRQGVRLREASLAWNPWEPATLTVGALDQDRWDAPLLLRRQSFPGTHQRLARAFGEFTVLLEATQAIVNDTSTLQRWGNWSEGLPSFFLERLTVGWKRSERTQASLHVSHYAFKDLSHQQAWDAQFLGNSVVGAGPEIAQFRYAFQGFEAGAQVAVEIATGWSPFLRADALWNHAAPAGRGLGWSASTGVLWEKGDRLRLRPAFEVFRVESDVSPALFSTRTFGHSNRQGWSASLGLELPSNGIRGQLHWVRSETIAASPLQTSATWVGFQLSMDYDAI